MDEQKILHLSDFEWASAARYVVWLSQDADLREIASDRINSFPLARLGATKLQGRKLNTLAELEGNLLCLERWAGKHKPDMNEYEIVIVRAMYRDIKRAIQIVKEHLTALESVRNLEQTQFDQQDKEMGEYDLPF